MHGKRLRHAALSLLDHTFHQTTEARYPGCAHLSVLEDTAVTSLQYSCRTLNQHGARTSKESSDFSPAVLGLPILGRALQRAPQVHVPLRVVASSEQAHRNEGFLKEGTPK